MRAERMLVGAGLAAAFGGANDLGLSGAAFGEFSDKTEYNFTKKL